MLDTKKKLDLQTMFDGVPTLFLDGKNDDAVGLHAACTNKKVFVKPHSKVYEVSEKITIENCSMFIDVEYLEFIENGKICLSFGDSSRQPKLSIEPTWGRPVLIQACNIIVGRSDV